MKEHKQEKVISNKCSLHTIRLCWNCAVNYRHQYGWGWIGPADIAILQSKYIMQNIQHWVSSKTIAEQRTMQSMILIRTKLLRNILTRCTYMCKQHKVSIMFQFACLDNPYIFDAILLYWCYNANADTHHFTDSIAKYNQRKFHIAIAYGNGRNINKTREIRNQGSQIIFDIFYFSSFLSPIE